MMRRLRNLSRAVLIIAHLSFLQLSALHLGVNFGEGAFKFIRIKVNQFTQFLECFSLFTGVVFT